VLYDGDCPVCIRLAGRFERVLGVQDYKLIPLQTPWVRERLGLSEAELLFEMRLLFPDGKFLGGADAMLELIRHIWWAWPVWLISRIPGAMPILRFCYRAFAARRHCLDKVCEINTNEIPQTQNIWLKWLPVAIFPAIGIALGCRFPGWVFMWMTVFGLFFAAKWLTLSPLLIKRSNTPVGRMFAYIYLWPGMDANAFCTERSKVRPAISEWLFALGKTFLGVAVLWFGVKAVEAANPLIVGWVGMFGVIFLLHFGTFHLLSLAWRAIGVNAKPIMRSPISATSLGQFWGSHWNNAFSDVMQPNVFRVLAKRINGTVAMLTAFLISGFLHELAISLPAQGGYGLPTIYFVTQGCGILVERSRAGRALGFGHGLRGWIFTVIVTAGPAFWLFHPAFIRNVILPMLHAIGAT